MTAIQKRAWWGLTLGLAFGLAFIIVFFSMGGIEKFDEDRNFRIIIDVLAIGALIVNLVIINVPLRKRNVADERDLQIIGWAPRVQWLFAIFTLAAWTIGLTLYYDTTGQVPTAFLFIVMLSVLVISTLAQSLGIIIGYWNLKPQDFKQKMGQYLARRGFDWETITETLDLLLQDLKDQRKPK